MNPEVSVVVVSYRTVDFIKACIASIFDSVDDASIEVIVVDNNSDDGTVNMVKREFPGVRVIASPENLGFARGVNLGASQARGEFLLLLNPDMVVHDCTIERLIAFARAHPEAGLYGGRTVAPDGRVDPSSCWGAPTRWSLFCFASGMSTAFKNNRLFDPESLGRWQRDNVRQVGVVTGCLLAVRRDVWSELGGFDPRYFMYGEDMDLSLRASAAGYRPSITPDAVVTHIVGASSKTRSDKIVLLMKGKATIIRTHWSGAAAVFGIAMLLMGVGLRSALSIVAGVMRPGRLGGPSPWREVWRARREWSGGYPPSVRTIPASQR